MNNLTEKKCTKCGEVKDLSMFYKGKNYCRKCCYLVSKDRVNKWRLDNHEKIKIDSKQYRINNAEKIKQWRLDNHEKIKYLSKRYYINNAEKLREKTKIWSLNNPEKCKERGKKYRINNVEKIKEYNKQWNLNNTEKIKYYCKNDVENITTYYLNNKGYPIELHELKRAQLKLKRLIKELN